MKIALQMYSVRDAVKDEETLQIGSYGLAVSYDSGDFRIDIEYVSE